MSDHFSSGVLTSDVTDYGDVTYCMVF